MPYNVICLACTVVALAFGPLHNITTKQLVAEEGPEKPSLPKKVLLKIKQLIKREKEVEQERHADDDDGGGDDDDDGEPKKDR